MLEVRLLGTPVVSVDGRPVEFDTRKAVALLAYLALEGGTGRDVLATLFWGDAPDERARATLRRTLSALRYAIGSENVFADRNLVNIADEVRIDVHLFESELASTASHDHDSGEVCASCVPHLERAAALFRGDFLEGFVVRDAPEFEDWARSVANGLRLRMGDALHRLALARAEAGDYGAAIAANHRWIDLDELHEPAHRLLMLLKAWAGDRPGSVEAYRAFVAILDRELGVPPLDETTELYEAILDEDLPPAPGVRRKVRTSIASERDTSLMGRQAELATLQEWWTKAYAHGRIGIVSGGPWMGKTRLVEEFSRRAGSPDVHVVTGRAYQAETGLPFGVTIQILRSGASAIAELGAGVPDWALEEVSKLLPRAVSNASPEPVDRHGELRLFEAIFETLAAVAADRPLLIIIDDAQWVDPPSASAIGYLGRRLKDIPALLLMVWRDGEPLPAALSDLRTLSETLQLSPLTATDIAHLVPGTLDAEAVVARSGGVPLLVRQLIDSGVEQTVGVDDYLQHRMTGISDIAGQLLTTASVLAGVCDVTLLREVSGRSEVEVVEAVDELTRSGLLREIPDTGGIAFTLDLIEQTVYNTLTLARRRLLHRRAAEALTMRGHAGDDLRLAAAIARQFTAAGDPRAASWYLTAADLARRVHANEAAMGFYENAVALGVENPARARLAIGELAMIHGDYARALQELTVAQTLANDGVAGLVNHRLGELHRTLGRFEIAARHFSAAEANHPEPSSLHADRALLHRRLGDTKAAQQTAALALSEAEEEGDPVLLSRAENVYALMVDDHREALDHLDRALEFAARDGVAMIAALNNKAHVLAQTGDLEGARLLVEQAIDIASNTGHRHHQAALHNHLADLHHRLGATAEAEAELTRAVALFAGVDAGAWEPEVWLLTQW